nr:immunoglobulin heavy chain junction region [Mus musculus]MBK4189957.1 immunoglobulin heavy chain junction region [Mus musculus]
CARSDYGSSYGFDYW